MRLDVAPEALAAGDYDPDSLTSLRCSPHSPGWSDFLRAALLADWACYPAPADRAEPERLAAVMAGFPSGFTLYLARSRDGIRPVGYTGWYPLDDLVFRTLTAAPETMDGRGAMRPQPAFAPGAPVYLFNYSLVPSLRRTAASRAMLSAYAAEIGALDHGGLAAVTVSEDGARFARRLGCAPGGWLTHGGEAERVYFCRAGR